MEWTLELLALLFILIIWILCFLILEDVDKKDMPADVYAKAPEVSDSTHIKVPLV